jgi:AraC-like DNA-binding protein
MSFKTENFFPHRPTVKSQVETYRLIQTFEEIEGNTISNGRMDAVITLSGKLQVFDIKEGGFTDLPGCTFFPFTRNNTSKILLESGTHLINIKFYPHVLGASCFNGLSLHQPLDFKSVFDKNVSIQKLQTAANNQDTELVSELLDTFFEEQLLTFNTDNHFLNEVFSIVERETDLKTSLEALTLDLGLSLKTLERHFKSHTGLTIKMYHDLVRFQKTVQQIKVNGVYHHGDLLEALGSGYYDQSHFVKASRKLTGLAPRELFSKLPAELTDFVIF